MPRVFKRTLEVPMVDVLDWSLVAELSGLFERYRVVPEPGDAPVADDHEEDDEWRELRKNLAAVQESLEEMRRGTIHFSATDSRGEYADESLEAFRAEVEAQHEIPVKVGVRFIGGSGSDRHFSVWWGNTGRYDSGALFLSEDEADVVYIAERCEDILKRAHERREARIKDDKKPQALAVSSVPPRKASLVRRVIYNPWVIGIGSLLVASGIIALIVALTHHHH